MNAHITSLASVGHAPRVWEFLLQADDIADIDAIVAVLRTHIGVPEAVTNVATLLWNLLSSTRKSKSHSLTSNCVCLFACVKLLMVGQVNSEWL